MLTPLEASEKLRVSRVTVYRMAEDGRLNPLRRKPLMLDEEDVNRRAAAMAARYSCRTPEAAAS